MIRFGIGIVGAPASRCPLTGHLYDALSRILGHTLPDLARRVVAQTIEVSPSIRMESRKHVLPKVVVDSLNIASQGGPG